MMDNLYVMESSVRTKLDELHAAASRERLAARAPRPPRARRALSAILAFVRGPRARSTALAAAPHPR